MKICIAQLSDIHIKSETDSIIDRAEAIGAAIAAASESADAVVLAFTGDIAFSGIDAQYESALKFVNVIKGRLGNDVYEFYIPGNHDLDFTNQPDTRPVLLDSISDKVGSIDLQGELVKQMLSVQNAFFQFESRSTGSECRAFSERLFYSIDWNLNGKILRIQCFNTAWVSQNPENPGQLVFPLHAVKADRESTELVISAFHHPYNWLAPDNKRRFQETVESLSDIILTGHEHESRIFTQNTGDIVMHYVEGAVLQEHNSEYSAFNCLSVDTAAGEYKCDLYVWDGSIYRAREGESRPFVRNRLLYRKAFRHTSGFRAKLLDIGMLIDHPHKRQIELRDLYVYPSLRMHNGDPTNGIIYSDQCFQFFSISKKLLVMAEELAGKTSLAKMLAQDLLEQGSVVPLLLKGHLIDSFKEAGIKNLLSEAISEQFGKESIQRFFQLSRDERILIIDDWDKIPYGSKGQVAIMDLLQKHFDRIICLVHPLYALERLTDTVQLREAFIAFESCSINPFGNRLIGQTIERWHSLGREYTVDTHTFERDVAQSEALIRSVVEREMLPTYPWFVISLLGVTRDKSSGSTNTGAYGHIFEALITTQLSSAYPNNPAQIGTLFVYLSRVAFWLFQKDRLLLSSEELLKLHNEYNSAFGLRLDHSQVVDSLVSSRIFAQQGSTYSFRYKWTYYYFVALYLAEHFAKDSAVRDTVFDITEHLSTDEYTNILMLFLYKTKEESVLDRLLVNASHIYSEHKPCDLDKDVKFVNLLIKETPKPISLPSSTPQENRDAARRAQDEGDGIQQEHSPAERVSYDNALHELTKLVIAFQHLRVMGQVLKNFPGVLERNPKFRLAEASYMLGLRTMSRILGLAQENLDELRQYFSKLFLDRTPDATVRQAERNADEALIWLTSTACLGLIKRVSRAVGVQDLQPTFEDILLRHDDKMSVKLIDIAIKLEHFTDTPETEIFDLEADNRKNYFSYKILLNLVYEHLLLRTTDTRVLQRLGQLFGIKTSRPQFLVNKILGTGKGA